jgi:hypothetical protein
VDAGEKLPKGIIANYNNQLQSSTIDLPAHVESLLQSLGATTSDSGGEGQDIHVDVRKALRRLTPFLEGKVGTGQWIPRTHGST